MEKKLLVAGVVLTSLFTSASSFANACVPSNLKENAKFFLGYEGKVEHVKVLKISESGCWVKVKDVVTNANGPGMPALKTNPYWVNFEHVSSVKKR